MATKDVRIKASAKKKTVAKKTGTSVVGSKKTTAKAAGKVALSGSGAFKGTSLLSTRVLSASPTGKVYKVALRSPSKGGGKTVVMWSPDKVLEARTTFTPEKVVRLDLSRSKVVGKHPEVKPRPAPESKLKLDEETRRSLLASMVLI